MSKLRFGVSVDKELLDVFDRVMKEKGYDNRSEYLRDLMRREVVDHTWDTEEQEVIGVAVYVYEHDKREVNDRILEHAHLHHDLVISTLHIHMDKKNCLEICVLRGKAGLVRRVGERIVAEKGVKFGRFIPATTGRGIV